jgi:hypothetical protein
MKQALGENCVYFLVIWTTGVTVCFRLGIWKSRGLRKAAEKVTRPLRKEEENEILLKGKETQIRK